MEKKVSLVFLKMFIKYFSNLKDYFDSHSIMSEYLADCGSALQAGCIDLFKPVEALHLDFMIFRLTLGQGPDAPGDDELVVSVNRSSTPSSAAWTVWSDDKHVDFESSKLRVLVHLPSQVCWLDPVKSCKEAVNQLAKSRWAAQDLSGKPHTESGDVNGVPAKSLHNKGSWLPIVGWIVGRIVLRIVVH